LLALWHASTTISTIRWAAAVARASLARPRATTATHKRASANSGRDALRNPRMSDGLETRLVKREFTVLALVGFVLCVDSGDVLAQATAPPGGAPFVIRAGHLFDGLGDAYQNDVAIIIDNERIQAVGPWDSTRRPEGAAVIDLSDFHVLPGLIDCHVHLSGRADRYDEIYKFKDSPFRAAFSAVLHARTTLEAGFTTVRDLGGPPFVAADLRDAIDEGQVVGPRIVASGPGVSMTGGHGDLNKFAPQVRVRAFPDDADFKIADGADQVRRVVRAQLKHNVDVIKIHATGGVLSRGDAPGAPQFTVDELRAAVEEAHAAGRKVAAHAHGAAGIKNAIRAGVDSIEHGSLIDDEGIGLMVERGVWLVADIYNDDYLLGKAIDS
jgi:imidazolonepropionase-like amidohydrolase